LVFSEFTLKEEGHGERQQMIYIILHNPLGSRISLFQIEDNISSTCSDNLLYTLQCLSGSSFLEKNEGLGNTCTFMSVIPNLVTIAVATSVALAMSLVAR
jgi:hypothetical protein